MKNGIRRIVVVVVLCMVFFVTPAESVQILLVNGDDPGEGFNDPTIVDAEGINFARTLGLQRQQAFQFAADIWASLLKGDHAIVILANYDALLCDAESGFINLGRAGATSIFSDFPNAPLTGTWYAGALADNLSGEDVDPGNPDIIAQFNDDLDKDCAPGFRWYYGLDGNPPSGTLDIIPTLLHEFAHGLGFANFVNEADGEFIEGLPDAYTTLTRDLIVGKTWTEMETSVERVESATRTHSIVWDGEQVTSKVPEFLQKGKLILAIETEAGSSSIFDVATADFGPSISEQGLTGKLELAQDGTDISSDACEPIIGFTTGNIAVIDRGSCLFIDKVQQAQDAGATGVIIVDNDPTNSLQTLGGTSDTITIPSVRVTYQSGQVIKEAMSQGDVAATLSIDTSFYVGTDSSTNKMLLYSPNPLELGSSISHWDTSAFPELLMEPFLSKSTYDVDLTVYQLQDMGWDTILKTPPPTATPIPTPTSTSTPTSTPTNTPRPNNHAPVIVLGQQVPPFVKIGTRLILPIFISDQDGDAFTLDFADNSPILNFRAAQARQFFYVEITINTQDAGEFVLGISAYDGSDVGELSVPITVVDDIVDNTPVTVATNTPINLPVTPVVTVIPSLTPEPQLTPTVTPTPTATVASTPSHTPRPDNNAPAIKINGAFPESVVKDSNLVVSYTVRDADQDPLSYQFDPASLVLDHRTAKISTFSILELTLDTSTVGDYTLSITVSDGSDPATIEHTFQVIE